MRKGQRSEPSRKLSITAVALQDHISRTLHLHSVRRMPCAGEPGGGKVSSKAGGRHHRVPSGLEEDCPLAAPRPRLTLAQKLGLVEAPPTPLSTEGWLSIKARSVQEGDSAQPCAICKEEFQLHTQVLLSCSHVFHRACLRSFEHYSGRKCCPLCRTEQYQTRVIHDGARLYRNKCASRIQACWRGYLVRKWYKSVRRTVPPKDKVLRRKFFEGKLQELSDRLVKSCNSKVDEFLSAIDSSLAYSRHLVRRFEEEAIGETEGEDWQTIQEKAVLREARDCSICLTALDVEVESQRALTLLSCSHIYHRYCLQAFEEFCPERQPLCPLCRCAYRKLLL